MEIKSSVGLIDKIEFSNYEDDDTYPKSIYSCSKCGKEVQFSFKDFKKHRFSYFSNLNHEDQKVANQLILSIIPKYKLTKSKQLKPLNTKDQIIVFLQRLYLHLTGIKKMFPPIPKLGENVPDSFIDYYCPKCKIPIRIYYFSFIGGRHSEMGFILMYVMI